ncbi:MAG: hypothetical protein HFJ25_05265 [Clostridia bacterium]|nr:hypothetical protein [Clostridia bacterium]
MEELKIEKVIADASTMHGEKICKKLLKMDYIRNTSHKSKIYCEEGETFINLLFVYLKHYKSDY